MTEQDALVWDGGQVVKVRPGSGSVVIKPSLNGVQGALDRVAAVREAVPELGIAVDFPGRVHKPMAKVLLKELSRTI